MKRLPIGIQTFRKIIEDYLSKKEAIEAGLLEDRTGVKFRLSKLTKIVAQKWPPENCLQNLIS